MTDTCCENEEFNPPARSSVILSSGPLLPMQKAPEWMGAGVKNTQLINISSSDYDGKYVVLLFYSHDFSVICPTEILQFSDRVDDFTSLDCEIVAISTDSEYSHLAWATTPRNRGGLGEMRLTMLSDKSHKISKAFGVIDEAAGTSYRALFVIDDKMILRHVTINDMAISRSVDEVLRVVEASQFADKYGNICPMGPKREPVQEAKSKEYFSPK